MCERRCPSPRGGGWWGGWKLSPADAASQVKGLLEVLYHSIRVVWNKYMFFVDFAGESQAHSRTVVLNERCNECGGGSACKPFLKNLCFTDSSVFRETCSCAGSWRGSGTASVAERRAIVKMPIAHLPVYRLSKVLKIRLSKDKREAQLPNICFAECVSRSPRSGPITTDSCACSDKEFIKSLTPRQMFGNQRCLLLDIRRRVCLSARSVIKTSFERWICGCWGGFDTINYKWDDRDPPVLVRIQPLCHWNNELDVKDAGSQRITPSDFWNVSQLATLANSLIIRSACRLQYNMVDYANISLEPIGE